MSDQNILNKTLRDAFNEGVEYANLGTTIAAHLKYMEGTVSEPLKIDLFSGLERLYQRWEELGSMYATDEDDEDYSGIINQFAIMSSDIEDIVHRRKLKAEAAKENDLPDDDIPF